MTIGSHFRGQLATGNQPDDKANHCTEAERRYWRHWASIKMRGVLYILLDWAEAMVCDEGIRRFWANGRDASHARKSYQQENNCRANYFLFSAHAFLSLLLLVDGVRLLVARLCRSVGTSQENQKQNHLARRIVAALASPLLVVKIGDRGGDASAWHRAGIFSSLLLSGNGTFVPRIGGETAWAE